MSYSLAKRLGNNKYQLEIENLKKDVSELKGECIVKDQCILDLEKQLQVSQNELLEKKEDIEKSKGDINDLVIQKDDIKKNLCNEMEIVCNLKNQYSTLEKTNSQLTIEIHQLEEDYSKVKENYNRLERELKLLTEKYAQLLSINMEMENTNTLLRTEIKYNKTLLERAQNELSQIKGTKEN